MSSPDLQFQVKNTLYSKKPDQGLTIAAGRAVEAGVTGTIPAFMCAGSGVTGDHIINAHLMSSQISSLRIYEGTKHTINLSQ